GADVAVAGTVDLDLLVNEGRLDLTGERPVVDRLESSGVLTLGGVLVGDLVNSGRLALRAPGVDVTGDVELRHTSTLEVDVDPDGNDLLAVGGAVEVDGTLAVVVAPGFAPSERLTVVEAEGLAG